MKEESEHMHIRNILAIARKDLIDIVHNRSTLVAIGTSIFIAVLFSFLNTLIAGTPTRVIIYNPTHSPVEQVIKAAFSSTEITHAASPDDVVAAFGQNGEHKHSPYTLGLIVPPNFESDLRAGRHPQLRLFINGDNAGTAQRNLLIQALNDYGRQVISPQPPLEVSSTTINPPQVNTYTTSNKAFFVMYVLVLTLMGASGVVPNLIIEEKEKKTLRMLMTSPASFGDIITGKLLVSILYEIVMVGLVIVIMQGLMGNLLWLFLFLVSGACLAIALGLLLGCLFNTMSAVGAISGALIFLFIVPTLFVGPLGQLIEGNVINVLLRAIPIYYLAEGTYNALAAQGGPATALLDLAVVLGTTLVVLAAAGWSLRRQAAVASSI
jgi:ABC-2 type transport system permease protein